MGAGVTFTPTCEVVRPWCEQNGLMYLTTGVYRRVSAGICCIFIHTINT